MGKYECIFWADSYTTIVVQYDFLSFSFGFLLFLGLGACHLLNLYHFRCLTFLLVYKVGVDLGCTDVLMGKHLADSVDVGCRRIVLRNVGVAEAVEGDVLGDTGLFEPRLQVRVDHVTGKTFENKSG